MEGKGKNENLRREPRENMIEKRKIGNWRAAGQVDFPPVRHTQRALYLCRNDVDLAIKKQVIDIAKSRYNTVALRLI